MNRRRERGAVLLLALLVLILLTLLIGQMAISAGRNRSIAENAVGELQNEYGVRSGYAQALLRIEYDSEKFKDVDTLQERWAEAFTFAVGEAAVRVAIEDAERRFNLSSLLTEKGEAVPAAVEMLQRLVQGLGHEPLETVARIVDYVDSDTKGDYEAGAKNRPLVNLDELARIEGLRREVLFGDAQRKGVLPLLTLWPGGAAAAGKIHVNPNTAPAEVLQSLDAEMGPAVAQTIMDWRSGRTDDGSTRAFRKAADLDAVPGMPEGLSARIASRLVFTASVFEVRATSAVGNVSRRQLYVVSRTLGEKPKMTLVTSQRENDSLSLPPPEEEK